MSVWGTYNSVVATLSIFSNFAILVFLLLLEKKKKPNAKIEGFSFSSTKNIHSTEWKNNATSRDSPGILQLTSLYPWGGLRGNHMNYASAEQFRRTSTLLCLLLMQRWLSAVWNECRGIQLLPRTRGKKKEKCEAVSSKFKLRKRCISFNYWKLKTVKSSTFESTENRKVF